MKKQYKSHRQDQEGLRRSQPGLQDRADPARDPGHPRRGGETVHREREGGGGESQDGGACNKHE